jgi:hypothetical protein
VWLAAHIVLSAVNRLLVCDMQHKKERHKSGVPLSALSIEWNAQKTSNF